MSMRVSCGSVQRLCGASEINALILGTIRDLARGSHEVRLGGFSIIVRR